MSLMTKCTYIYDLLYLVTVTSLPNTMRFYCIHGTIRLYIEKYEAKLRSYTKAVSERLSP
jgi:hypothetical protein